MGSLEFEVGNASQFVRAMGVVGKLMTEGCFEVPQSENCVRLRQMDPSHVSMVNLSICEGDTFEFKRGDKVCFDMEDMNKVLGRMRTDDEKIRIHAEGEDSMHMKVVVEFRDTQREFTMPSPDIDLSELPEPKPAFTVTAGLGTKMLKATLKDIDTIGGRAVRLESSDDEFKITAAHLGDEDRTYTKKLRKGDSGLLAHDSRVASAAQYPLDYMEKAVSTDFDRVDLKFGQNLPISVGYELGPHSSLQFFIAPRIESE